MRQSILGLVLALLALAGCNTVRGASRDVSYPSYSATAAAAVRIAYIPVGRLIVRQTPFKAEGGGYAIVILRRPDEQRNRSACMIMRQSMRLRIGPADGRPIEMDEMLVEERPVYWPVTIRSRADCADMLRNYDFDRALANLQRIPNSGQLGRGPFVIVRRENGSRAGLFDFSKVAVEDFDDQFAAVVSYMSQRADVWRPEFYQAASVRQMLRYYILDESGGGPIVIASLIDLKVQ